MNPNETTNTPETPVKTPRKHFPARKNRRAYIGNNEHVYRHHLPRLEHAFQEAIDAGAQLAVFIIALPHNRSAEQKAVQYEFTCPVPVCSGFKIVEANDTLFYTLREVQTWAEVLQAVEELQPTIRRGYKLEVYGLNAQGLTMPADLLCYQWDGEPYAEPPMQP